RRARRRPRDQRDAGARRGARRAARGPDARRSPVSADGDCGGGVGGGRACAGRLRGARRTGSGLVPALDRPPRAHSGDAPSNRLARVMLDLATAGESHGPALVAILSGLPAGLVVDKAAVDADLKRRQQGYGRSPRQQIETDEVEVLAGLRHGRTLGTPLALVVRNRDHKNWTWGMSPWPPEGEPEGKGKEPVTLPRPG